MLDKTVVLYFLASILGCRESFAQKLALEKCKEFEKLYERPNDFFPNEVDQIVCNPRVVPTDDHIAKYGEFPYMAALYYTNAEGKHFYRCSAALISPQYLLTPAYCTLTPFGAPLAVRFGYLNASVKDLGSYGQQIDIINLKPHPKFNSKTNTDSIALIKLEKSVKFNKYVHPICLHTEEVTSGDVIASGWAFRYGNDLMKDIFQIYPQDECSKAYEAFRMNITDGQFCLGTKTNKCDTMQQGIVLLKNDKVRCMDSLVGLINYGPNKACTGTPDVFTKISPYIRWIESIVWE